MASGKANNFGWCPTTRAVHGKPPEQDSYEVSRLAHGSHMTEDSARTKWCPFSRVRTTNTVVANKARIGVPEAGTYCIASNCMAWRWTTADNGYCGLAGKP